MVDGEKPAPRPAPRPKPALHKPKNAKAKRAVEKRLPRTVETLKKVLLLHGGKTSAVVKSFLTDVGSLKRGESLKLSRSNEQVRPFETGGEASLEFLARKADTSLFLLGSHSKKRPHNVVLGRMFDFRLFDMLEFGLEDYKAMREFAGSSSRAAQGSKPCLLFLGGLFDTDAALRTAKSLLLDLFRGRVVTNINLRGLDRVLVFTAPAPGRILMRQAATSFRKAGVAVPRVELEEMGPSCTLTLRRLREPPFDLRKEAHVAAKEPKRKKNVGSDSLVGKVGRVFVPRQEVETMPLTKPKGVKRGRRDSAAAAKAERREGGEEDGDGDDGDFGEEEPVRREPRAGAAARKRKAAAPPAGAGKELTPGNVVAGTRKGLAKKRARAAAAEADDE